MRASFVLRLGGAGVPVMRFFWGETADGSWELEYMRMSMGVEGYGPGAGAVWLPASAKKDVGREGVLMPNIAPLLELLVRKEEVGVAVEVDPKRNGFGVGVGGGLLVDILRRDLSNSSCWEGGGMSIRDLDAHV